DTPEESKEQLNRAGIEHVDPCFYSHGHPDHTAGRRLFESLNFDFRAWPRRQFGVTDIYLPQQVAADFGTWLGLRAHFEFLEEQLRVVRVHELADGDTVELEGFSVRPFRLAEDYIYPFQPSAQCKRVHVALDA